MCNCSYFCHQVVSCKLPVASSQLPVAWPDSSLLLLFLWRFLWSNETNELFGSLCSQTEVSFVYCNNNKCNNSCNWPQSGKRLCHHQLPVGIELFKTAWGVFTSNCSNCLCKWNDGNAVFWSKLIKVQQSVMWFSDWQSKSALYKVYCSLTIEILQTYIALLGSNMFFKCFSVHSPSLSLSLLFCRVYCNDIYTLLVYFVSLFTPVLKWFICQSFFEVSRCLRSQSGYTFEIT